MANFKCSFQDEWKKQFNWIQEVAGDRNRAFCGLCQYSFNLSNMGLRSVTSHEKGKKHQLKQKSAATCLSVANFLPSSSTEKTSIPESNLSLEVITSISPASTAEVVSSAKGSTMDKFLLKETVAKAEIKWCLQAVSTHKSFRSASTDALFFKDLFPDSDIAKSMQLGRDKMAYMIVYGISLYVKEILIDKIIPCEHFVIGFDESFNKISQKQQLDINVRFWDMTENKVKSSYLTSAFLGRTRATDLLETFTEVTKPLNLKRLVQVSMDGPNVNKKFFKDLQAHIREQPCDPKILNIGSCGLHAVNNSFKTGAVATHWNLQEFHRALYYLFNKSPSRRALYTFYSASSLFPKKFCTIRWLENSSVANRALDMLPYLKSFVDGIEKDKVALNSNSFNLIKESLKDKLLPAKLAFFKTIACELEGFLREYQADVPLIPFLFTDLSVLLYGLMERFVKKDKLSSNNIMEIELNDDSFCAEKQIDVGILTMTYLKKAHVSEKAVSTFRKDCRNFLVSLVNKMRESSPLMYSLTKAVSCFDPSISLKKKIFSSRLVNLLLILTEKNWIAGSIADKAKKQMIDICSRAHVLQSLNEYRRQLQRIDSFWYQLLSQETESNEALRVIKIVMIFAHGNAAIERGFSVNKDCLFENLKEDSLIARRRVYDFVSSAGGVSNVEINKQMVLAVRNARSRYSEANEARLKEDKEKTSLLKRRREAELQLKELEAKKAKIQEQAQKEKEIIEEEILALK